MGVGGRRITFCAVYGACVISVDRSKWESVSVVGDASLGAELEKVRFGDGFVDRRPEKPLMKVTGALSREAASCSMSLFSMKVWTWILMTSHSSESQ